MKTAHPRVGCGAALLVALAFSQAAAHHSDTSDPSAWNYQTLIEVCGVLAGIEWRNPHVRMYVDVVDDGGRLTTWTLYFSAPNHLMRRIDRETLDRDLLPAGTPVRVEAFPHRDGSAVAGARTVARADGWMVSDGPFSSRALPEHRIPCRTQG